MTIFVIIIIISTSSLKKKWIELERISAAAAASSTRRAIDRMKTKGDKIQVYVHYAHSYVPWFHGHSKKIENNLLPERIT